MRILSIFTVEDDALPYSLLCVVVVIALDILGFWFIMRFTNLKSRHKGEGKWWLIYLPIASVFFYVCIYYAAMGLPDNSPLRSILTLPKPHSLPLSFLFVLIGFFHILVVVFYSGGARGSIFSPYYPTYILAISYFAKDIYLAMDVATFFILITIIPYIISFRRKYHLTVDESRKELRIPTRRRAILPLFVSIPLLFYFFISQYWILTIIAGISIWVGVWLFRRDLQQDVKIKLLRIINPYYVLGTMATVIMISSVFFSLISLKAREKNDGNNKEQVSYISEY